MESQYLLYGTSVSPFHHAKLPKHVVPDFHGSQRIPTKVLWSCHAGCMHDAEVRLNWLLPINAIQPQQIRSRRENTALVLGNAFADSTGNRYSIQPVLYSFLKVVCFVKREPTTKVTRRYRRHAKKPHLLGSFSKRSRRRRNFESAKYAVT